MEQTEKKSLRSMIMLGPAHPFRGGLAAFNGWGFRVGCLRLPRSIRHCSFRVPPNILMIRLPRGSISLEN
jgi:hypothetical protein